MAVLHEIEAAVRECPLGCGWAANRRVAQPYSTSVTPSLTTFIERCRRDIAVHLIAAHSATPSASPVKRPLSPEGLETIYKILDTSPEECGL